MQSKPSLVAVLIILLLASLAPPLAVAQRPEEREGAGPVRGPGGTAVEPRAGPAALGPQSWDAYYEPNNTCAEAYGPLTWGQAYLAYPDDMNDYYFFTLTSASTVDIAVTNYAPTSSQGDVLVYGPAAGDECGGLVALFGVPGYTEMRIDNLALGAGKYHVRTYTIESGYSTVDLYTLRVTYSLQNVLWDQPLSTVNQNAYASQETPNSPTYSIYLADDFVSVDPWLIDSIFIPGSGMADFITLLDATALTWQIYADSGGVPAGDPSGGGSPAAWTLSLPPDDPQVAITTGSGAMPTNVQLTLTAAPMVPPGHWWLVFYPTLSSAIGMYGRQPADTLNGYSAQLINPGGAYGLGTSWQDWSALGPAQQDMAFRIEGTIAAGTPVSIVSVTYLIDGREVSFDATVDGSEPITYAWEFGDGEDSDQEDPVHTYALGGCYDVTLTASNPFGPDDTWTDTICASQQTFIPLAIRQRWSQYYEPNDRCEDAYGPLAFDQDYLAYPDDQEDYYTFALASAGTVTVTVDNYVPTTDNGQLLIYGPAVGKACGEQVAQFGEPGLTKMWVNNLALEAGTYHVRIRTEEGDFPRDQLYKLRVAEH